MNHNDKFLYLFRKKIKDRYYLNINNNIRNSFLNKRVYTFDNVIVYQTNLITSFSKKTNSSSELGENSIEKPNKIALLSALVKKGTLNNNFKNGKKLYTSYSKLSEMKLISISLASSATMRYWAEKTLPNGKVLGKVTTANTLHHKTFKPLKGGLFCERIFGPLKDFECACGIRQRPGEEEYQKILEHQQIDRKFCPNCDVEYTWSIIRRYQMGYIELVSPVSHIWYLKANPSYLSILLDIKRRDLESIIYCSEISTLEIAWKANQNWNLEASLLLNFGKTNNTNLLKNEKTTKLGKKEKIAKKIQLYYQAKRIKDWRSTSFITEKRSHKMSKNFSNFSASFSEKEFSNDPNYYDIQMPFEKSLISSQLETKIRKEFLNILLKKTWQSFYKEAYRIAQEKSNKLLIKLINKLKIKNTKKMLVLKPFLKSAFSTSLLINSSSFPTKPKLNDREKINGNFDNISFLYEKNLDKDIKLNVILFKKSFSHFLDKTTFNVEEIPLNTLLSFFMELEILDISFFFNKNLEESLTFFVSKKNKPFDIESTNMEKQTKNSFAFKIKSQQFNQIQNKNESFWKTKKEDSGKRKLPLIKNVTKFSKIIKFYFYKSFLLSLTSFLFSFPSREVNVWQNSAKDKYSINGNIKNEEIFNDYINKKIKNPFLFIEILSCSFLKENELLVRVLANYLTKLLLVYNLKQSVNSFLSTSAIFPRTLISPKKQTKDNFVFFEIIKSITKKELSLLSIPNRISQSAFIQKKENNHFFFQKSRYFGLSYTEQKSLPFVNSVKISSYAKKNEEMQKIQLSKNLLSLSSLFFLEKLIDESSIKEFQKTHLKAKKIFIQNNSFDSLFKESFLTQIVTKKNQIFLKNQFFLKNRNSIIRKNSFFNWRTKYNFADFQKPKVPKVKLGFSILQLNNNISSLSHRCRWKTEKNWQDFSNYYLAKRTFNDLTISCYKNRVLNTVNWTTDNTIAGASIIQRLLLELNSSELKKMDKQNRILLYELTKKIQKLKSFVKRNVADKFDKKQLKEFCEQRDQLIRRTKLVRKICRKNSNPSSMILSILPILPPDLRPILKMQNQIAASDLNRLYQRVIYRNDRFKKFQKNPAISNSFEIKYSQRLLQEAVDNLIQNGKSGVTPERDSRGRLLKSLSEVLKGKQGRFRQYLLGKRVDYSGRSVIVVGPKLKLHECGLPIEMAIELFLPFLIKRILHYKYARTVIGAKTLIKTNKSLISQMLREVMEGHPVLLNRAPTLHRLGFQAFQPKLIEGRAILLHPLVCPAFNADFDGDQMAVHIPLTVEARAEAWKLMFSRNNLISPATGDPVILPSQDMVLGCYYLTTEIKKQKFNNINSNLCFSNLEQVIKAYNLQKIKLHEPVWVKWHNYFSNSNEMSQPNEIRIEKNGIFQDIRFKYIRRLDQKSHFISQILRTTPGRILFNLLIERCKKDQKRLSYKKLFDKN